MTRVFAALIRHGQFERPEGVPSAHLPHPLTPDGERAAAAAAALVLQDARDLGAWIEPTIECSPLLRAWQSARILAKSLAARTGRDFQLSQQPDLRERSLGSAANLTLQQIESAVARDPRNAPLPPGWRRRPGFRLPLPGAESLMEAGARAAELISSRLAALAATATRDTLKLVVGHAGALRHAAVHLGVLPLEQAPRLSMEYAEPVVIERQGDGSWCHVAGQWKKRLQGAGGTD